MGGEFELQIELPAGWRAEREFAVRAVFESCLGLPVRIRSSAHAATRIHLPGGGLVEVADAFPSDDGSTDLSSLVPHDSPPSWAIPARWRSLPDISLMPVVFGDHPDSPGFLVSDHRHIRLGYDIFATAMFLLCGLDEMQGARRDRHDRLDPDAAYVVRTGLLARPIVDELATLLMAMFMDLCPSARLRARPFQMSVTHDIDRPLMFPDAALSRLGRRLAGDITRRRSFRQAVATAGSYARRLAGGPAADPFYSFDSLMDVSEQANLTSTFYFLAGGIDPDYDPPVDIETPPIRAALGRIGRRGHEVGLHGSYSSHGDPARLRMELDTLRRVADHAGVRQNAWGGRQHYLRWAAGTSPAALEHAGLGFDSTVAFSAAAGFRAGTCSAFPLFDLASRRSLAVIERPLVAMDASVLPEIPSEREAADGVDRMLSLKRTCRNVGGTFTYLFHNDRWAYPIWRDIHRAILAG